MKYLLILTFLISSLFSYEQSDLDKLLKSNDCQECDLKGANLSNRK